MCICLARGKIQNTPPPTHLSEYFSQTSHYFCISPCRHLNGPTLRLLAIFPYITIMMGKEGHTIAT